MDTPSSKARYWALAGAVCLLLTGHSFARESIVDSSFDPSSGPNGEIKALAIQRDGKILVGGAFTSFAGVPCQSLVRLHPDGQVDRTFRFTDALYSAGNRHFATMALLPDQTLVVASQWYAPGDLPPKLHLTRVLTDGGIDPSFQDPWTEGGHSPKLAVQPDGQILLGTTVDRYVLTASYSSIRLRRLNPNGSLDETFTPVMPAPLAGISDQIDSVILDDSGQIWVGGEFASGPDPWRPDLTFSLLRCTPQGVASGFHPAGVDYAVDQALPMPDGKLLVLSKRNTLTQLKADVSVDSDFHSPKPSGGGLQCAYLEPDGRILVGGSFSALDGVRRQALAALNPDGSLDLAFDPLDGAAKASNGGSGSVDRIVGQPDGKVLVAGNFTELDGYPRVRLARVNTRSVAKESYIYCGETNQVLEEASGKFEIKVVRAGDASETASVYYETTGSTSTPDADYVPVSGTLVFQPGERTKIISVTLIDDQLEEPDESLSLQLSNPVGAELLPGWEHTDLQITSDDILVEFISEEFTAYESQGLVRVWLNRDIRGAEFSLENSSAKLGHDYLALRQDGSGTISIPLLDTTEADGTRSFRIHLRPLRPPYVLNEHSHATVTILDDDTALGPGRGANGQIRALCPAPNGKWYIGGDFDRVDGLPRNRLARLQPDGLLDATFDPPGGADATVTALCLQPDGCLLVGGYFTNFAGRPWPGLARLDAQGKLDESFRVSACAPTAAGLRNVRSLALQPDGRLLVGSTTWRPFCSDQPGLLRLLPDGTLDPTFRFTELSMSGVERTVCLADSRVFVVTPSSWYNRGSSAMLRSDGSVDSGFSAQLEGSGITAVAELPDGTIWTGSSYAYAGQPVLQHVSPTGKMLHSITNLPLWGERTSTEFRLLPGLKHERDVDPGSRRDPNR